MSGAAEWPGRGVSDQTAHAAPHDLTAEGNPSISDANASLKLRGVMQIRNSVFETSRQFWGFFFK